MASCKHCGTEFKPYRPQNIYCSDPCRYACKTRNDRQRNHRRERAPVVTPSEQKPVRRPKMTNTEFERLYAQIQRDIIERGGLLFDPSWRSKNIRGMGVEG